MACNVSTAVAGQDRAGPTGFFTQSLIVEIVEYSMSGDKPAAVQDLGTGLAAEAGNSTIQKHHGVC